MMGTKIKQKFFMGGKKHFPPDMGDAMSYEDLDKIYDEKCKLLDLFSARACEMMDNEKSITSIEEALRLKHKVEKIMVNIDLLQEDKRNLFIKKQQKLQEARILEQQEIKEKIELNKKIIALSEERIALGLYQEAKRLEIQKHNDKMDMLRVQCKASQQEVKDVIEGWSEHNKDITTVQVEDWDMKQVKELFIFPTVKNVVVSFTQEYDICHDLTETIHYYACANVLISEEFNYKVDIPTVIEDVNDSEGMKWDSSYDILSSVHSNYEAEKGIDGYEDLRKVELPKEENYFWDPWDLELKLFPEDRVLQEPEEYSICFQTRDIWNKTCLTSDIANGNTLNEESNRRVYLGNLRYIWKTWHPQTNLQNSVYDRGKKGSKKSRKIMENNNL